MVLLGVLVKYTSTSCISNILLFTFASLLIYQVSRVAPPQWLFPSLQKHLVSGLGLILGLFISAATVLPFHEVSLLALAFLETWWFYKPSTIDAPSWFLLSQCQTSWIAQGSLYLSLICYSSSRSSHSLVAVTLENHHHLIWKINSHLIQAIVVLRQSEHTLNDWAFLLYFVDKESCRRSRTS